MIFVLGEAAPVKAEFTVREREGLPCGSYRYSP
jgi:hypothetical protein